MSLKNLQKFNPSHPGDRRCAGPWVMQAIADLSTKNRRITRNARLLTLYYPEQRYTCYATAPLSSCSADVDVASFLCSPQFLRSLAESDRRSTEFAYRAPLDDRGEPLF